MHEYSPLLSSGVNIKKVILIVQIGVMYDTGIYVRTVFTLRAYMYIINSTTKTTPEQATDAAVYIQL